MTNSEPQTKQLTLLFLMKDDQILLALKKRGFGAGNWNGVGGKIELTETLEHALIRECQEEISVTPLKYEKVAELTFNEIHEGERKLMQVHAFICHEWEGEPTESEEMKPSWFATADIPYTQMWDDDTYWLPSVLKGKKIRGEFMHDDNNKVVDHKINEVLSFR